MTKMSMTVAISAIAALSSLCAAAQAKPARQAPEFVSSLPKQPREAPPALKMTVGKPFSAGYVFIDGKYVKPPYRVERYGTVIQVNGIQATNQIIPWDEFLKTQPGVKVTKTEVAAPEPDPVADVPEPEPEPAPAALDDVSTDLDDLFADEAKPKSSSSFSAPKPRRAPRPHKPAPVITYTLEGPFVPNDRTKRLVEQINQFRTKVDSNLRTGGYYFFGSRYALVSGGARNADRVVEPLCKAMKECTTLEEFVLALRRSDAATFPQALLEDLFRNRVTYLDLERRVKDAREQREFRNMINRSR